MDKRELFHSLQFDRPIHWPSSRALVVGLGVVVYVLAWGILPTSAAYWLGMLAVAALVWAASYGWRQALVGLIALLEKLLQF